MKTKKIGKLKQKIIISLMTVIMTFTLIMPTYSKAGVLSEVRRSIARANMQFTFGSR